MALFHGTPFGIESLPSPDPNPADAERDPRTFVIVSKRSRMRRAQFRRLVSRALEDLPAEFREKMSNIQVVVQAAPTAEQEDSVEGKPEEGLLLGLYEGVPLPERGSTYGGVLPDRITLFQDSIEAVCRTQEEIVEEIRTTVLHEIAHHFGIDDDRLDELGI
jgi:predicted Zn-dependent protease with MMP-like domain